MLMTENPHWKGLNLYIMPQRRKSLHLACLNSHLLRWSMLRFVLDVCTGTQHRQSSQPAFDSFLRLADVNSFCTKNKVIS